MSSWFEHFGYSEVGDGLLAGAYPTDAEDVAALAREHVDEVVNLCEDAEYAPGERDAVVIALREGLDIEQALEVVRERKPRARPLEHQRADLLAWWAARS